MIWQLSYCKKVEMEAIQQQQQRQQQQQQQTQELETTTRRLKIAQKRLVQ